MIFSMKTGNPFVQKIDNYSGTRCSELKSDHRENYIPRGHFLTDEPTIDNQRENPPKTERILWSLKNQNTSRSCVLTQMRNFALYRHFHSSDVFVTDFPNTSSWMLQVVAYNLKHSNNNSNNKTSTATTAITVRVHKYPWISRSLEANAHVPHHIATLINHRVSMKLHFATTH